MCMVNRVKGNRVKVPIEGIITYQLILDTVHHLDLLRTLYVLVIMHNLISFSALDISRYILRLKTIVLVCIRVAI